MAPSTDELKPGQFRCKRCGRATFYELHRPFCTAKCARGGRRKFSESERQQVFAAHKSLCYFCGKPINESATGDAAPALHHILEFALGGPDEITNLAPAHRGCNKDAADSLFSPAIGLEASVSKANGLKVNFYVGELPHKFDDGKCIFCGIPSNSEKRFLLCPERRKTKKT